MKVNSRKIAMELLNDIERRNSFSNKELLRVFTEVNIEVVDRRFISKLVYGVTENKLYLDYMIRKFSSVRLKKINPSMLNLLRIATYQIIFLSKTPDSAAVNEAVKLAKKISFKHSGFVNGLLRNLSRDYKKVELPNKKKELVKHLSVKYSHPEWMVLRWLKEFGDEFTENLLEANNETPFLVIRVNTLLINREDLITKLELSGIECEKSDIVEDGIKIIKLGSNSIETLEEFKGGLFTVQDESSMLVSGIVNPKQDDRILDLCSAPGGKTTHLSQLMNNRGKIIACDISDLKINMIKENQKRLKLDNIEVRINDALILNEDFTMKFDKVLVDAPCSGLGIIRRKPDIKYNKTEEDIAELNKMQIAILRNAAEYVKVGGNLIYSTCTIEESENRGIINQFLKEFAEFSIEEYEGNEDMQLYPNVDETDGFYCCKLIKK